jgi:hypothetical protein
MNESIKSQMETLITAQAEHLRILNDDFSICSWNCVLLTLASVPAFLTLPVVMATLYKMSPSFPPLRPLPLFL